MRFEGSLTVWHVERGYGTVLPEQGGQALFIHISAFPQEGPQPVVGERISFEIVSGRNNQKQASKVQRLKAATIKPSVRSARRPALHKSRPVLAYVLFGVAVAAGLASWLLFNPADGERLARAARLSSNTTSNNNNGIESQSVCLPQGSEADLRSAPLRVRSTASKA